MATLGLTAEEREAITRFQAEVLQPSMTELVMLDFWAEWCGPCKQLGPVLDKVAADLAPRGVRLVKVDVDKDRVVAGQFQIRSVPTVYAIYGGQPVADLTPYRSEGQLKRVLEQLLGQLGVTGEAQEREAEIEPLIAMAEEVLDTGDAGRAQNIFRQIVDMAPEAPEPLGGLARALIAGGQAEEARALLDGVAPELARDPAITRARAALDLAAAAPAGDPGDLQARLAADPDDHQARYDLAGARMAAGDRDGAADALLEIIQRDREWNEGAARTRFLQLLEATGLEDAWARAQRRRLSALLFT